MPPFIPTRLIPQGLSSEDVALSPQDFTRRRKLPLLTLFVVLLSLTASGKHQGVDGKIGALFRQARRSGLWPDTQAVHRSAVTKAQAHVSWTAFDPDSGLEHPRKGHYPQCLVSTAYDVFRRLPIARTVQTIAEANEREEVKALLPHIPHGGVLLFDRGYPSYELLEHLTHQYPGFWLLRAPGSATFPAVETFVHAGQVEATLTLTSPKTKPIRLRAIRLVSPEGECSVLLTNLLDGARFPVHAVINLYWRRWALEVHYRDEKTSLDIETFHSQTENGIRQKLFAIQIMAVIARTLMVRMTDLEHPSGAQPQFKHALLTLASEAALLTPTCPDVALGIFQDLLREISRVRYYRPKVPRRAAPCLSNQPGNKWRLEKTQRMARA